VLFVSDAFNNRVLAFFLRRSGQSFLSDTFPDYVFGQPSFDTNVVNNNGVGAQVLSAVGLYRPIGVAVLDTGAPSFSLFVADGTNGRILSYNIQKSQIGAPNSAMDTVADAVWGSSDFITSYATWPIVSNSIIRLPAAIAVTSDRLYIATMHARVLVESLLDADNIFDGVYGQPDYVSQVPSYSDVGLWNNPYGVALDPSRSILAIGDQRQTGGLVLSRDRIVFHTDTTGADTTADDVIGDSDYLLPPFPQTPPSSQSLARPTGIFFRGDSELWVADFGNNRVLRFDRGTTNTPVGNNVSVSQSFVVQGFIVTVKFASVSQPGNTSITLLDSSPPLGTDFRLTSASLCPTSDNMIFQIGTTATFTTAEVTIDFSGNACLSGLTVPQKLGLELLHFDFIAPDPDTVTQNILPGSNKIVSQNLSTLSPFVVAERIQSDLLPPRTSLTLGGPNALGIIGGGAPGETFITSATTIELTAVDDFAEIGDSGGSIIGLSTFFTVDTNPESVYSTPFSLVGVPDGVHMISFRSIDAVGNAEIRKITRLLVDNSVPLVSVAIDGLRPSNDRAGNEGDNDVPGAARANFGSEWIIGAEAVVTIAASDTGSGLQSVEWRVDTREFRPYLGPFEIGTGLDTYRIHPEVRGESHALSVRVIDALGNRAETVIFFRLMPGRRVGWRSTNPSLSEWIPRDPNGMTVRTTLSKQCFRFGEEIPVTIAYVNPPGVIRGRLPNPSPDAGRTRIILRSEDGRILPSERHDFNAGPATIRLGDGETFEVVYPLIEREYPSLIPPGRYSVSILYNNEEVGHHVIDVGDR
jgi:hypothetical protein